MRNFYLTLTLLLSLVTSVVAQDGYTYTFQHSGGYTFTVQAVPNTSSNNFATSVQSYGFTIILPDGVTITSGSSLGSAASATFFDGTAIGQPAIDGYLVTETLGSPATLTPPSAATNSNMFTYTVNGTPTSGTMYILPNNSTIATTITPLKSFMQADMIDNGSAEFVNVVDPNAAAVSGMSTFDFSTLSVPNIEEESFEFSLYPNPASNKVEIISTRVLENLEIEMFDSTGKQVPIQLSSQNTFDVSKISSGLYLININSDDVKMTKKLIIK